MGFRSASMTSQADHLKETPQAEMDTEDRKQRRKKEKKKNRKKKADTAGVSAFSLIATGGEEGRKGETDLGRAPRKQGAW